MEQPKFNTPALADLAAAFFRRGKAIRYHGTMSLAREVEGDEERLTVDYSGLSKLHLRLSVWSTGDWCFLACKPRRGRQGGWLLKHVLRGKLRRRPGEKVVQSFEASMLVAYWPADEQHAKLRKLWDASQIRPIAEGDGACLAPDTITVDGRRVGYMYREPPDPLLADGADSGWRFMAGDETREYVDDPKNWSWYDVNSIANYDPDIVPLLDRRSPIAFARDDSGRFVEEKFKPGE